MSTLRADNIVGRDQQSSPNFPKGAVVTGVTTAATFAGDLQGNASTSTKFASSKTIGGVAFDGSSNISLPGVDSAGNQNTTGTSAGLTGTPNITVGDITAAAATFSGNVSIAKTLTYEDVKNVDSQGIGTFRTGIEIGPAAGIAATITTAGVYQGKLTTGICTGAQIGDTLDVSTKTVTLPAAAVTAHVASFDDSNLRKDIALLALQMQVASNGNAFNLGDSWVDQFKDTSGVTASQTMRTEAANDYYSTGVSSQSARYWRMLKTSTNAGGGYHTEMELIDSGNVDRGFVGGCTQQNLQAFNASNCNDNNTSSNCFHTDSAGIGAWFRVDLNGSYTITKWRTYVSNPDSTVWDIQYSNDDSTWTTAAGGTGWVTDRTTGTDQWKEATFNTSSFHATGTITSTAQTASSARTKVSGVLLYKDADGTNTLGTDLKISFTCNGGTNWTDVTAANQYTTLATEFSTGIKQVKIAEQTCTSGTDVRYKVTWANQVSGSKSAQVYGVGINY